MHDFLHLGGLGGKSTTRSGRVAAGQERRNHEPAQLSMVWQNHPANLMWFLAGSSTSWRTRSSSIEYPVVWRTRSSAGKTAYGEHAVLRFSIRCLRSGGLVQDLQRAGEHAVLPPDPTQPRGHVPVPLPPERGTPAPALSQYRVPRVYRGTSLIQLNLEGTCRYPSPLGRERVLY